MSAIPTVYFIDDSATMREVIKIAFRRENINVVACHDATLALVEIEKTRPDIVITDVIMPDKDGYEVCQYIKSHPDLAKTPVVLMSGVVNRAVAERAFAVKADELLRKPFQPQDLIARVKHLLKPNGTSAPTPAAAASAAVALSSIFSAAAPLPPRSAAAPAPPRSAAAVAAAPVAQPVPGPASPFISAPVTQPAPASASASPFISAPVAQPAPASASPFISAPVTQPAPPSVSASPFISASAPAARIVTPEPIASASPAAVPAGKPFNGNDAGKLKVEIMRMEGLVKKLQAELQAEREYSHALEAHIKTLQEADK